MTETNPKYCPVCSKPVRYAQTASRGYWVHLETGRPVEPRPSQHDVNTYAPDRLLDAPPEPAPVRTCAACGSTDFTLAGEHDGEICAECAEPVRQPESVERA